MMSNKQSTTIRNFTISHAIRVTKKLYTWKLSENWDITGLAQALGTSREFAAKVLTAVRNGNEDKLFSRNRRRDSIQGSGVLVKQIP